MSKRNPLMLVNSVLNKPSNVALIDSNYTLFLYFLLFNDEVEKTLFIVSDGISKCVRDNLINCIYLQDNKFTSFKKIREILRNVKIILSKDFRQLRKNRDIVFFGQDHAWFSFLGKGRKFILLEDGYDNYAKKPNKGMKRFLLSYLGFPYLEFGRSSNIEKIYLSNILPTPEDISHKVVSVNIDNSWKALSPINKTKLFALFAPNKVHLLTNALNYFDSVLILTQPLNQDGLLSENNKIKYYLEATSHLDGVKDIWFKRHPRDTTDYSSLGWKDFGFSTCPIELLIAMGLQFKKVITYNSTAIYRFPVESRILISKSLNDKSI
ncbi:glycosyltransferase family 52 [Vibrio hangzhouensis]|uniref:glycosyltransferase family 52 n=1 Tax=Vibrio hangzhouensis TaxID=462991 RepID=UPI001C94A03A|nr:glycosyltransferase family 52 [Vibrio hangzhouensis]MBY6198493.1 glycosyltransferase family 52 protein [Vibrio hangzhouensis]